MPRLVAQGLRVLVVTNDVVTTEDAQHVRRALTGVLVEERIVGVETGACPHTAVREDPTMNLAAVEDMFALKDLLVRLGSANFDCRQDGAALDPRWGRATYLFNATIPGIDEADGLMIVGANPRTEAPVLNARIRKRWRTGGLKIGVIG